MTKTWDDLNYFNTTEWEVVKQRIYRPGAMYNPGDANLFRAFRETPLHRTKVVFIGQDPYPDPEQACGLAFSIPEQLKRFPPTLLNIFREYQNDTGLPFPRHGSLLKWANRGVLLWNALPTCEPWWTLQKPPRTLSHNWPEWHLLTKEICQVLDGVVYVFLGGFAREFVQFVDERKNRIIETSHPAPRGATTGKSPFLGSRVFTRTNALLCELGLEPIEWRLT